jgi:hypothetical protein
MIPNPILRLTLTPIPNPNPILIRSPIQIPSLFQIQNLCWY